MPEEPDVSPEEMEILDRIHQQRLEELEPLRAEQRRLIANRIMEALQSRPEGMKWSEIREMFDKKLGDQQIRQALQTLKTTALTITIEKKGEHAGERFLLTAS